MSRSIGRGGFSKRSTTVTGSLPAAQPAGLAVVAQRQRQDAAVRRDRGIPDDSVRPPRGPRRRGRRLRRAVISRFQPSSQGRTPLVYAIFDALPRRPDLRKPSTRRTPRRRPSRSLIGKHDRFFPSGQLARNGLAPTGRPSSAVRRSRRKGPRLGLHLGALQELAQGQGRRERSS